MNEMIRCSAKMDFKDGSYFMTANTGQPMCLCNYQSPVIIDLRGATFAKDTTPVLYYHDDWMPIGVTTQQVVNADGSEQFMGSRTINSPGVYALWKITNSGKIAAEVRENAENGFPYEVSIGARPSEIMNVPKGQMVTVNGKEYEGPLVVATSSTIHEISICVFGACPGTGNVKASQEVNAHKGRKGVIMGATIENVPTPDNVQTGSGTQTTLTPQIPGNIQASQTVNGPTDLDLQKHEQDLENERRKSIEMIAKFAKVEAGVKVSMDDAEFRTINAAKNYALKNGISADDFEKACIQASLTRSVGPTIHSREEGNRTNILQCSSLLSLGIPGEWLEKNGYTPAEVEAADRHQYPASMLAMMGETIKASGMSVDYLNPHQVVRDYKTCMIQAANTSTTDLGSTNIFSPLIDKKMRYQYEQLPSIWKTLYEKRTVRDFKSVATVDWTISGKGKTLIEDEDYPTVKLTSTGETYKTDKQGIIAAISWETQINDDMGELGKVGGKLVELLYDEQCDAFWTDFWSSFSTKYNTTNKNKITKTLTTAGLSAAKKAFRALKNANGRFLKTVPAYLLVPTALEDAAWELFKWKWAGENNTKSNIHEGKYQVLTDPYLGTDGGFTGASDTGWFMIADPKRYPLGEFAVLNGFAVPKVVETWFDHKDAYNIRAKGTMGFHGYTTNLASVYSDGTTN